MNIAISTENTSGVSTADILGEKIKYLLTLDSQQIMTLLGRASSGSLLEIDVSQYDQKSNGA